MKPMFLNTFLIGAAAAATAFLLGSALPALAYDVTSTAAVNVDANGVILRGVDATSYADGAAPVASSADFSAEVDGAAFLFASAAAHDSFVASPETFEPAFGGFCATGCFHAFATDVARGDATRAEDKATVPP